jgi:hypothetical protein
MMESTAIRGEGVLRFLNGLFRRLKVEAFICGCGHSGTTLIANILAQHPDIYLPLRETEIFLEPEPAKKYKALKREAASAGKRILVEKTPRHVRHLDLIRKVIPRARFVMPVRDGRDVADSIRNRAGSLEEGIDRWISDNSIVAKERGKPGVLIYRHEDLVANPEKEVLRICGFLGVAYDRRILDFHQRQSLWYGKTSIRHTSGVGPEHEDLRNWQVNQPIFNNQGRWRRNLKGEDLAKLTQGTGQALMQEFGYL